MNDRVSRHHRPAHVLTLSAPPANTMALETFPSVLFSMRSDETSGSSTPAEISRKQSTTCHALASREQHHFQRSIQHCVHEPWVFDVCQSIRKCLFAFRSKIDHFPSDLSLCLGFKLSRSPCWVSCEANSRICPGTGADLQRDLPSGDG